jgi:hypothetical protein
MARFISGQTLSRSLLRSPGNRRGVERCGFRQHAPVMGGTIMKDLVP